MEINELRSTIKGKIPNFRFQAPNKFQFSKFEIQNTIISMLVVLDILTLDIWICL
jgi:hypothetical protein